MCTCIIYYSFSLFTGGLSGGAIVGIVFAAALTVLIGILLVVFHQKRNTMTYLSESSPMTPGFRNPTYEEHNEMITVRVGANTADDSVA